MTREQVRAREERAVRACLSTGVAGELLQKLANYPLRMAAVVPDPSLYSRRFQVLAREASTGTMFRFFRTRQQAIGWLES